MFWVTEFPDVYGATLTAVTTTVPELSHRIDTTLAPRKDALPALKMARFGSARTAKNSLRHDANVLAVSGVEGDCDGGMPFAEAVTRLEKSGLAFIAYTTPRHVKGADRWRVLLPFSAELQPPRRLPMACRVNGILGGVLGPESGVLSQAFYYGHVVGVPFEIANGDSDEYIDEADALDATAIPLRPSVGAGGAGGKINLDGLDETGLVDLIRTGQSYYRAASRLLGWWALQRIAPEDAEANLLAVVDAVDVTLRDAKWTKARASVPRWVTHAYQRGGKKGGGFIELFGHLDAQPEWKGAIRVNRFGQALEVCDPFPPQSGQPVMSYRPFRDPSDTLEALLYVQGNGFPQARKHTVFDALVLLGERHGYHPVIDWLGQLHWDGTERLYRLFIDYFPGLLPDLGQKPSHEERKEHDDAVAYLQHCARCFLIAGVARIVEPGCKHDHLPVIVGPQGWGKSRGLAALMPSPKWFSDDLSVYLIDKDTKDSLTGKWLIELAEIPHVRRQAEQVKSFFSRPTDRFRRPYDRLTADWPRTCFFAGSSNDLEFQDPTGARRFWPIALARPVDVEAIANDRGQLWAEAVVCHRRGDIWWLPPALEPVARKAQELYIEEDTWDEHIIRWLIFDAPRDRNAPTRPPQTMRTHLDPDIQPFTLKQVLEGLGFDADEPGALEIVGSAKRKIGRADEMRCARRLKFLGYQTAQHRARGTGRARCWVRSRS